MWKKARPSALEPVSSGPWQRTQTEVQFWIMSFKVEPGGQGRDGETGRVGRRVLKNKAVESQLKVQEVRIEEVRSMEVCGCACVCVSVWGTTAEQDSM